MRKQLMRALALVMTTWLLSAHIQGGHSTRDTVADGTHSSHLKGKGTALDLNRPGMRPAFLQVGGSRLSPTIDGALTPEQIPDYVAYRHLLMAVADQQDSVVVARHDHLSSSRGAAVPGRNHRDAILKRLRLSSVDREAMLSAVATVNTELHSVSDTSAAADRKARRDDVFQKAFDRLDRRLSAAGRTRLRAFLKEMKSEIRVYGDVLP